MNQQQNKPTKFKEKFLNNKFVVYLMVLLLTGVTILVFSKITFVFTPIKILIQTVALPIVLAGIFFYLFGPIVDFLQKKGVKRWISILSLYILIMLVFALIIGLIIPNVKDQFQSFVESVPKHTADFQNFFSSLKVSRLTEQVEGLLSIDINEIPGMLSDYASDHFQVFTKNIASVFSTVTQIFVSIAILPFLLFYLLKDGNDLPNQFVQHLPNKMRKESKRILFDMNEALSHYIRGQIIVSFSIGVMLYIGYLIIGLEYALMLAILALVTNVVPYIGPIIAILPAIIVAIISSPIMILKVAILWAIVQLIESKFISPQIMGKYLNIHPITVIFVILVAGNLFGIIGIIFAVPGYAVLKVITTHIYQIIRLRSDMYSDVKLYK